MSFIENRTFEEIKIGDSARIERTLSPKDIELFSIMSGDVNPAHVDAEYAKDDMFHQIIVQGMWGAALISTVLGTELPGPGTIYLDQTLKFTAPVVPGDTITIIVTVTGKKPDHHIVDLECKCVNQNDKVVISGVATVMAPTVKVKRPRIELPKAVLKEPKGAMSGMEAAGMVMGASVPIILTSRGSDDISRKASCAMALIYVRNKEKLHD